MGQYINPSTYCRPLRFSDSESCQYSEVHYWVYLEGPPPVQLFQLFMIRREGRWSVHSSLQRELCSPMMDGLQGPRSLWVRDNHSLFLWQQVGNALCMLQTRGIHESHNGANHPWEKCTRLWACWSVAVPEDKHAKHYNFYCYRELFLPLICCHSSILNVIFWLKDFCQFMKCGQQQVSYSLRVCKRGTTQSTNY